MDVVEAKQAQAKENLLPKKPAFFFPRLDVVISIGAMADDPFFAPSTFSNLVTFTYPSSESARNMN